MDSDDDRAGEVEVDKKGVPKMKKAPKREQTPAQKEATKRMLEALKAKRQQQKEDQEKDAAAMDEYKREVEEAKRYENAKRTKAKRLPPVPNYVTTTTLQIMEKRILDNQTRSLNTLFEKYVLPKAPEPPKPEPVPEPLPLKTVEIKVPVPAPAKIISGNALLDSIFFK